MTSAIRRYTWCFRAGMGWAGEGLWGSDPWELKDGKDLTRWSTGKGIAAEGTVYAKTPWREGRASVKHEELVMVGCWEMREVKAGDADKLDHTGPCGQDPGVWPPLTILLAAAAGRVRTFPTRAIFTSSVLASIFLWVRASRRTHGSTPRSWINGKQNAIQ